MISSFRQVPLCVLPAPAPPEARRTAPVLLLPCSRPLENPGMPEDLSHEIGVARFKSARLIYTETTYFNGVANREMYKDIGVTEVEILAPLDTYTCGECSPLDGLWSKMVDYEPGVTVPPFHPNCRCTTIPAIDDDEEDPEEIGQRAARLNEDEGGDGKTYYVPEDMTYSEWKKKFLCGGGEGKNDVVHVGHDWKR